MEHADYIIYMYYQMYDSDLGITIYCLTGKESCFMLKEGRIFGAIHFRNKPDIFLLGEGQQNIWYKFQIHNKAEQCVWTLYL